MGIVTTGENKASGVLELILRGEKRVQT